MVVFNQKLVTLPSTDLSSLAQSLLGDESRHSLEYRLERIAHLLCSDAHPEWEQRGSVIAERNCFLGKDTWKF